MEAGKSLFQVMVQSWHLRESSLQLQELILSVEPGIIPEHAECDPHQKRFIVVKISKIPQALYSTYQIPMLFLEQMLPKFV